MPTYAIGDIQGCFIPFRQLLKDIEFDQKHDRLWLVGDLVNRGPDSLAVLRFVRELGEAAVTVLGNHDLHLLTVSEGFARIRKKDTLNAILAAPDRDELLTWLRRQPLMYVNNGYAMVHAGLLPSWTIGEAESFAREAEAALRSEDYPDLLAGLYGDTPDAWRDDLTGIARIRAIFNALTRLRVCTPQGKMDFSFKSEPEKAPAGFLPWFDVPDRASSSVTVIFGHWSALGLRLRPNLMALDSGCQWGRALTAVRLEDRRAFQVRCG